MFSHSEIRQEARAVLRRGDVPFLRFAGLNLLVTAVLNLLDAFCSGTTYEDLFGSGPAGIFVYVLTMLISLVLEAGRVEYCAAAHRGERAEYADLFCGFSYAIRFITVMMLQAVLVGLGFSLFLIPGILLLYRYRFALYILCEDPSLSATEILRRSGEELKGFKGELFLLDLSFLAPAMLCVAPLLLWQYAPLEFSASLPDVVVTLISTLLTFPSLLLIFYRTAAELGFRSRILQLKYPQQETEL